MLINTNSTTPASRGRKTSSRFTQLLLSIPG
jgi:hypothetical protein